MTTLVICLALAALLPYLAKLPVMKEMSKLGGYDNRHPREQQAKLTGYGARALAAHQNAFEALIVFSAAVSICLSTQIYHSFIQFLAIVFIILRVIYHYLYLIDKNRLRSLVWGLSMLCAFGMMVSSIFFIN